MAPDLDQRGRVAVTGVHRTHVAERPVQTLLIVSHGHTLEHALRSGPVRQFLPSKAAHSVRFQCAITRCSSDPCIEPADHLTQRVSPH
jgi:hypothetical protein